MLVKIDYTGTKKSVYKCDRCEKELVMGTDDRYKIIVNKNPTSYKPNQIKFWDLCRRCYKAFDRAIEKGVPKKDETNIQH